VNRLTICFCAIGVLTALNSASAGLLNPLAFSSSGTLTLTSGTYTITTNGTPQLLDSSNNVLFTGTTYSQGGTFDPTVSVLDFSSISIGSGVTIDVTGSDPLALLSLSGITVDGTINGDGGNGQSNSATAGAGGPGAGAGGGPCVVGQGPGGGQVDSPCGGLSETTFGTGGGFGGNGATVPPYTTIGATYGDLYTTLEGGSGGSGAGGDLFSAGSGAGGGGGGLELAAITSILVGTNGQILADGGSGGVDNIAPYQGGGGSGGGILLGAPTVTLDSISTSQINANAGDLTGGGGRILVLTSSGCITDNANGPIVDTPCTPPNAPNITASGSLYGQTGIVQFGTLSPSTSVPEPASVWLVLAGLAVAGLYRLVRPAARRTA